MARTARHDADYFPFYVKDGKTLFILESKYGLQGIGFFTNLLRFLTRQPDHHLCVAQEPDLLYFFSQLRCPDVAMGIDMLNLMAKTGKIDPGLWTGKRVIVSPDLLISLEGAYKNRKNEMIKISEIVNMYPDAPVDNFQSYPINQITYPINALSTSNLTPKMELNPENKDGMRQRILKERILKESSELISPVRLDSEEECPPFDPPKSEPEKPKEPVENKTRKPTNTHGERWTDEQGKKLEELMTDIKDRYGDRYHQQVYVTIQSNFNRGNPDAILRGLQRLIADRLAGKSIPMPGRWLESLLNGNEKQAGENGKFEARESERQHEELKRDDITNDRVRKLTAEIGRASP